MKNNWKITIACIGCLLCFSLKIEAQSFKKNAAGIKKIHMEMENVGLTITGYNGSEVLIEAGRGFSPPPARAKGLRPLYNNAVDNTGVGLQVDQANNVMTIRKASHQDNHYILKVPASINIKIIEKGWQGDDFELKGINGEIEIKSNGSSIDIEDSSGPIVASTTSGNITVVFSKVDQQGPTSISNISGFVDVSLPGDTKADLVLSSISGEIYTDLDLDMGEGSMKRIGGRKIRATYNGGGAEIALKAISGNIYLRKK